MWRWSNQWATACRSASLEASQPFECCTHATGSREGSYGSTFQLVCEVALWHILVFSGSNGRLHALRQVAPDLLRHAGVHLHGIQAVCHASRQCVGTYICRGCCRAAELSACLEKMLAVGLQHHPRNPQAGCTATLTGMRQGCGSCRCCAGFGTGSGIADGGADMSGISRLKALLAAAVMSPTAGNMVRFAMRSLHIFRAVFFCMAAADVRRLHRHMAHVAYSMVHRRWQRLVMH